MDEDPLALLPEICLLAGAIATLLAGSFLPRQRQWIARILAALACIAAAAAAIVALASPTRSVFADSYAVDPLTGTTRLVVAAATLLVLLLGTEELRGSPRESETCCLLLLSATGATVLAGTTDLLVLAVAYLLTSIPLYALIGSTRTARAAEAVMKTYLLGALFGIVMLLGVTLLFAMTGGTGYAGLSTAGSVVPAVVAVGAVAVLAGLLFEAGAVPGHFWVPDAAQSANTAAAAFLTTVPKVGALVAMFRLVDALPGVADWPLLVAALSALSMTVGTFAAFAQRDPRRLLGWSTVSQVGFLLLPVAVAGRAPLAEPSLLIYLAGYAVSNLAAFAVIAAVPDRTDLAGYRGLSTSRPWLAGALLVALLSLVGTPPTAVFLGKLTTFTAAWDGGLAWLVIVAAVNTVASLFYFLRWLAPTFTRAARAGDMAEGHVDRRDLRGSRPWAERTAVLAAAGVLLLGVGAGSLPILVAIP